MLAICNLTQSLWSVFCIVEFQFLEACVDSASEVQVFLFWSLTFSTGDFILIKGYHSVSGIRQWGVEFRTTVNQVIHYLIYVMNLRLIAVCAIKKYSRCKYEVSVESLPTLSGSLCTWPSGELGGLIIVLLVFN